MFNLLIRIAVGLPMISGALIGTEAVSAYHPSQIAISACDTTALANAGQLTHLAGQDAWISKRGQIFRLSQCPSLKDSLIARNS